jgi:CCR4-NOT transcription complex subunit 7/8
MILNFGSLQFLALESPSQAVHPAGTPTSPLTSSSPPFGMAHYASLYHGGASMPPLPPEIPVRSVWEDNLELELRFLHSFVHNARYAAVNIHYPGVIHNGSQKHTSQTADERYSVIKTNVDALKPIQVGLAIYNDFGHIVAWEFNLRGFHPVTDPHAANSVGYLQERGLSQWAFPIIKIFFFCF